MTVLHPKNRHVFACLRELDDDVVPVINNLSDRTESVLLDLSRFRGYTPVELFSQTPFPLLERAHFHFTVSPYGYFWLALRPPGSTRRKRKGIVR